MPTPGSRTVAAGSPAAYSISAMPQRGSFESAVRFSCGTLPANASCSFAPTDVVPGINGRDVTLTVATRAGGPAPAAMDGALTLGLGLWLAATLARGRGRRSSRTLTHVFVVAALVALTWCGGGPPSEQPPPAPAPAPTTAPGTYSIAVTGTSGAMQHSTSITLTVQ